MWSLSPPLYEEGKTGYSRELMVVLISVVSSTCCPGGIHVLGFIIGYMQEKSGKPWLRRQGVKFCRVKPIACSFLVIKDAVLVFAHDPSEPFL